MKKQTFLSQIFLATLALFSVCRLDASQNSDPIEVLALDIIPYEQFAENNPDAIQVLRKALFEKGIVGIKGIPGYKEKVERYIAAAQAFSALTEEEKEAYAPNREAGDLFLGYEKGKEQFKRPDGRWVIDDLKVSYYAFVPEDPHNKWPKEVDLQTPFQELGLLMSETAEGVMKKIGLLTSATELSLDGIPRVGRMLYYRKSGDTAQDNPLWCGSHFDHGIFTALLPAFYFVDGQPTPEPIEAGLFVKTTREGLFKKVVANDPDVMLFQVGEFGQLITNDAIRATEHKVHKASGNIERYTLALFFDAPMQYTVHSHSELTSDSRYGSGPGQPCTYQHWTEESFKRYIVK